MPQNKLIPEHSNPYVPGRCWRKLSDTGHGVKMCYKIASAYDVFAKPLSVSSPRGQSVVMWLCDKCKSRLESWGFIVQKITVPK